MHNTDKISEANTFLLIRIFCLRVTFLIFRASKQFLLVNHKFFIVIFHYLYSRTFFFCYIIVDIHYYMRIKSMGKLTNWIKTVNISMIMSIIG